MQDDLGVDVAQTIARWLVMFLHRPGGQTQFASPVWVPRAERSTVRAVQDLVEAAPGGDHRLPTLAAAAAMSVRHFTRVFTAEVGESPSRFVERTRVEAARRELETTSDTLDVVAARCGLGSAETLRRVVPAPSRRRPRRLPPAVPHRLDRKGLRMTDPDRLQIAIPIFPRCTALDAIGPYEVLQRIPTFDITFVGHAHGEVRTENAMLGLQADATFEEVPEPDVIVFPGGVGTRPLEHDDRVLDWVRHAHQGTRFTTSVCTGSLVLGAAGLLDGLSATTHWSCYPRARRARRRADGPAGSSSTSIAA